jgi:nicotinamide mononucleotide transporter
MIILNWIINHYLEIFGVITGLVSIYFQIRQKIWLWPVSIACSFFYVFVYFEARLYAEISLQIYYVIVSVYGWFYWVKGKRGKNSGEVNVTRLNWITGLVLGFLVLVLVAPVGYLLDRYSDTDVPYIDAVVTVISFAATWMLARKILENWLVWIFVDFLCIGVYIYKGLYPTSVFFAVLTILAFKGYSSWKKSMLQI